MVLTGGPSWYSPGVHHVCVYVVDSWYSPRVHHVCVYVVDSWYSPGVHHVCVYMTEVPSGGFMVGVDVDPLGDTVGAQDLLRQ